MDLLQVILLLVLGFLAGTVSVIAGVGGGVFFVTFMILLVFQSINYMNIATDTSTFIILLSSLVGFITYLRQKRTTIRHSLIFATFSIIGSILYTIFDLLIDIEPTILKILFATTLLFAGGNMIYKAIKTRKLLKLEDASPGEFSILQHDYKSNLKKSIPLFILAGFLAPLLGIGGGIINTPVLNIILRYPIHNATAISTSVIFFTALYNTIINSLLGQIDLVLGLIIAIGAILGSIFGARISKRIPRVYLQFFVAIVLIGLAIRMYF